MDNIWADLVTVLVNIIHVKLCRQKRIPLDCDHGVFFSVHILGIDIDLRAIECRFPHILHKRNLQFVHDIAHMLLGLFPHLGFPDIFLRIFRIPFGKMIRHIFLNTQCFQTVLCKGNTLFKLLHHLIRPYDQMPLRNRKLAHPGKPVHLSGILIPKKGRGLAVTKRQIPVRMLRCLIYKILERAGHGPKGKHFLILFLIPQHKHSFFIMIPVSGKLVKVALCHKRRLSPYIPPFVILKVLDPTLHGLDHLCTLRHKERKPLSNHIHGSKQLHLAPQLIVVAKLDVL